MNEWKSILAREQDNVWLPVSILWNVFDTFKIDTTIRYVRIEII